MKGVLAAALLAYFLIVYLQRGPKPITIEHALDEYDFIVVGAGSAGGVVASRLSETNSTVLLVEAGPMDTEFWAARIPGLAPLMQESEPDWGFVGAKQRKGGKSLVDNCLYHPRGKLLGGSSSVNWLYWARGMANDYDQWALEGNSGWTYDEVLPYFLKMEDMLEEELRSPGRTGGPVGISHGAKSKVGDALEKLMKEKYKFHDDANVADYEGFFRTQTNVREGVRQSSAESYIRPSMNRENLHVLVDTMVTKLNFNENKEAIGVTLTSNGLTHTVKANKEIVLSAGAIMSPVVLMRSGIGPAAELKKGQVDPVVVNENVGANMEDHLLSWLQYYFDQPVALDTPGYEVGWSATAWLAKHLLLYHVPFGDSALANSIMEVTGFIKSGHSANVSQPDLQLYFAPLLAYNQRSMQLHRYIDELVSHMGEANSGADHFLTTVSSHQHPRTRGSVTLNAKDPFGPPVIDYQVADNDHDIDVVVAGHEKVMEILNQPEIAKFGVKHKNGDPNCGHHTLLSKDYLRCMAKHQMVTVFHHSCTCRMGVDRRNSVVDPRLRVHGVTKLRIADASVMPHVTTGNTNAPTMMIGEKAADMIAKDHNLNS